MPGGDRTGPMGMGPMTGRAEGYCAGFGMPGFMNPATGWGRGFGRGFGRGWGRGFGRMVWGAPGPQYGMPQWTTPATPWGAWPISREEELQYLKDQAQMLREELDAINERVGELEAETGSGEQE